LISGLTSVLLKLETCWEVIFPEGLLIEEKLDFYLSIDKDA